MDCSFTLIIAEGSWWLQLGNWWAIAQVILGLGAVIFVHELGHFLVAKACGVKCEKFYVGFDVPIKLFGRQILPAALIRKQIGETEYGIGMIPVGGYVKMLGQDDNPSNIQKEIERSQAMTDSDGQVERDGYVDQTKLDPRSYRAKSVPQRMAIISAGVIFNLMFAVLFAALAFRAGVDYSPPMIGRVVAGGPAWEQDLEGSEILRIGDRVMSEDQYFDYTELAEKVIFSADEGPISMEVRLPGSNEGKEVSVTPVKGLRKGVGDYAMLGITSASLPAVGSDKPLPGTPAASAKPALKKGDVIESIDGESVESVLDLRRKFHRLASKEVELLIRRELEGGDSEEPQYEEFSVTLDRKPVRETGFSMSWGKVALVQKGSPAESAGLKKGDLIQGIGGSELLKSADPLTFDARVAQHALEGGTSVSLRVKRGGQTIDFDLNPVESNASSIIGGLGVVALDTVGLAVEVPNVIGSVVPESKIAKAGIKPGDEVVSVTYLLAEEHRGLKYFDKLHKRKVEVGEGANGYANVYDTFQEFPVGTELLFEFKTNADTPATVSVELSPSTSTFLPVRGIVLKQLQKNYRSKTWADAFSNGVKRVQTDASRVWKFLTKLVTGKLSVKNLGGPGTIAVVATSEASQGTSRLLLFLTLLSANLAIVNFLPIPVLDGGHMVFLTYEGLFRRPVSEKVEILLTYGGLFFILSLMLFVLVMDVTRISKLFF